MSIHKICFHRKLENCQYFSVEKAPYELCNKEAICLKVINMITVGTIEAGCLWSFDSHLFRFDMIVVL